MNRAPFGQRIRSIYVGHINHRIGSREKYKIRPRVGGDSTFKRARQGERRAKNNVLCSLCGEDGGGALAVGIRTD